MIGLSVNTKLQVDHECEHGKGEKEFASFIYLHFVCALASANFQALIKIHSRFALSLTQVCVRVFAV